VHLIPFGTASCAENADGYLLTQDMMRWFWDHYLADGDQGADPLASPLRASDLSGLPAAYVITAEFDPLRDEGEAFAARLSDAGVAVTCDRYDGHIQGLFQMPGTFPTATTAAEEIAAAMRATMARHRPPMH
jgi:acetyl esterase